jgi:hypothetical protein
MAQPEPSPPTQIIHEGTSDDQSSQVLDPPILPFIPTPSDVARPSTGRTSVTQVDHGDEEQQPVILLAEVPTSLGITSSTSNDTHHQAPEDISTLSQDQQQSVQQPPVPSAQPQAMSEPVPQTPQTYLTFLLISGKRRTMSFEPDSPISRVKELVWNSWPTEWQDEHPPAPSYLRVLYLGKMLQDDETLIGLKLPTYTPQSPASPASSSSGPIPTIMHLSIRPYAPPSEGDIKKKKKYRNVGDFTGTNGGEGDSDANCCRCVIA